jgi:RNA polymerase sigma-70 factor, ECF subfamily
MDERHESRLGDEFTVLLHKWRQGDSGAGEQVMLATYEEMRRLAASYLRGESSGHTLQPTALVHELFMKLLGGASVDFANRSHFLALCARQLRHILVDHARKANSLRRGGDAVLVGLGNWDMGAEREEGIVKLNDALEQLEREDPRSCHVVELRFFGGLKEDEIAEVLGISLATVKRDWTFARAWLHTQLQG